MFKGRKKDMDSKRIKDYILCYMRERSKLDIEDYISSFYKDEEITAEQLDEIYAWLDRIYDDVIA